MKKILLIVMCVCGLPFFTSCDDELDIPQKGVGAGVDEFYKTPEDAISARTALYESFVYDITGSNGGIYVYVPLLLNEAGDDLLAAGGQYGDNDFGAAINEFRYDINNEVLNGAYQRLYKPVYKANLIIDNFANPEDATIKQVVAEARVIRAYCHYFLAVIWGDAPLIDHCVGVAETVTNSESQEFLLKWVAEECEAAAPDLLERQGASDYEGTAIATKGMAYALAGKAYAQIGNYAKAAENLKKVIDSGKYSLVPASDFEKMFHVSGKGNSEVIFQPAKMNNPAVGDFGGKIERTEWMWINFWAWRVQNGAMGAGPAWMAGDGWGGCAIRADFAQEMLDNEGDSPRRKATFYTEDEFWNEMPWNDPNNMGIQKSDGLYGFAGYFHKKNCAWPEDAELGWYGFRSPALIRYADVLLLYAECTANGAGDSGLGKQCLNQVQNRAGAPETALSFDAVKKERKFELWSEGQRWIDMCRYKEFDGVKNNGKNIPSTFDEFYSEGKPTGKPHKCYVTYSNPNGDNPTGFVAGKHEVFPFPYCAVSVNPDLKQHAGWE